MKNLLSIIISLSLVIFVSSACDDVEPGSNKNACHSSPLQNYEYRCCYVETKIKQNGNTREYQYCQPATNDQYKDMKKFKDYLKALYVQLYSDLGMYGSEVKKIKVDCNASYIQLGIIGLLFLLF